MRSHLIALGAMSLILAGAAAPNLAQAADSKMAACAAQWQTMKKAGTAKGKYTDFSKTCMKANAAAGAPAATPASAPAGETAKKPSALSNLLAKKPADNAAPAASGAAAAAGGAKVVKTKASTGAAKKGEKADNNDPTGATGQCKDNTYTHAKTHSGACAGHGGVAKWL